MAKQIAIIGMAGRYPQSPNISTLWQHLIAGTDLSYQHQQPLAADIVKRYYSLEGINNFDYEFFGYSKQQASRLDPQHRLFLECSYLALQDAGCHHQSSDTTGVFASASVSTFWLASIAKQGGSLADAQGYAALLANDKDFLATRVAHKLNLTGPALTVQAGCSSSLVAANYACQSLQHGECEQAVVGGVSVTWPAALQHHWQQGGILAPDGICRPFDQQAQGTVKGDGCSVVVLKPLAQAIADHNKVYATIEGIAVNNDGSDKIGFTAPSITGQSQVIAQAHQLAGKPEINYIETHGTGTKLGDPIEIKALNQVYGKANQQPIFLGSIKANIGHLDAAAGITSLVKAVQVLQHQQVPPLTHFSQANSYLHPDSGNFIFPTQASKQQIKVAAVSSFGMGGTNCHAVVAQVSKNKHQYKAKSKPQQHCYPRTNISCELTVDDSSQIKTTSSQPKLQYSYQQAISLIMTSWQHHLDDQITDVHADFFALGGDSLIALDILDDIARNTQIELSVNDLAANPTPYQLAQLVADTGSTSEGQGDHDQQFVFHIRSTKQASNLFMIHPAGGTTICYRQLNQHLRGEYNLYAIDLPNWYQSKTCISDLAASYIEQLYQIQPEGPYLLGGYSFGGNLAHEMARQLEDNNQSVSGLLLLDSHPPEAYNQSSQQHIEYRLVLPQVLVSFFCGHNLSSETLAAFAKLEVQQIISELKQHDLAGISLSTQQLLTFYHRWVYSHQLLKSHKVPGKVQAPTICFAASEPEDANILSALQIKTLPKDTWQSHLKRKLRQLPVPGDHYSLLGQDANLAHLGPLIDQYVRRLSEKNND